MSMGTLRSLRMIKIRELLPASSLHLLHHLVQLTTSKGVPGTSMQSSRMSSSTKIKEPNRWEATKSEENLK